MRWTEEGLAQGGFYFPTLLHEIGHGHGMAHPHDNGGHSTVMPGADGGTGGIGGGLGDYLLSQQVFTVMSYNDGWQSSPYGMPSSGDATGLNSDPYGWQGTLAALDIAVIQDKYGVNEDYAAGNDSYVIKDVNAPGTFFQTLWDAGGTDEVRYNGARAANIDLRPASLKYEIGGGGWVSYAYGIYGGYTIANGVAIENAIGGSGADTVRGNDADNALNGRAGADTMFGYGGHDTFIVDNAGDWTIEAAGRGSDTVFSSISYRLSVHQSIDLLATTLRAGTAALSLTGNELAQRIDGNYGDNVITGEGGADTLSGFLGNDLFIVRSPIEKVFENAGEGSDTIFFSRGYSLLAGQSIELLATSSRLGTEAINLSGNDLAQRIDGNSGANTLYGNGGNDALNGFDGDDRIVGGAGRDRINGGAGSDTFAYGVVAHSTGVDRDLLEYVNFDQDRLDLQSIPTAIDAKVAHGGLNTIHFDANLAAAIGAAQLGPHHAVVFDPDAGDLNQAGHVYLIVDINGVAGYQAGQDYVFELQNSSGTLTSADFI